MEQYKEKLRSALQGCTTPQEIHNALGNAVMEYASENWQKSKNAHLNSRRACYFSMEFLVGRAVFNNLLCLGIYDETEAVLNEMGKSLSELEEIEDAALGNGGLGRLAACFLDSAASLDLPLDGYGAADPAGGFLRFFRRRCHSPFWDGHPAFREPFLALIFQKFGHVMPLLQEFMFSMPPSTQHSFVLQTRKTIHKASPT